MEMTQCCATKQPHKSIKHNENDIIPLSQSQSPLCKILLY